MTTRYMIRRVLCPWKLEELVDETVDYCRRSGVDEIIWITESAGMYRELLPLEEIDRLLPGLRHAKERTEAAGMIYSINPLTTIGHGEYGTKLNSVHPEMDFMVDITGKTSIACACPLSSYWRKLMIDTFRRYAETNPARLWIEDDYRYNNHGSVKFGCFCDRHLEAFNERVGGDYDRQGLVDRLLRPGTPDPARGQWLEFLADTLSEFGAELAREVHAVTPDVQLGWMAVTPVLHDMFGANAHDLLHSLANGRTSAVRMHTIAFQETSYRDMLVLDENIKQMLPVVPDDTLNCTEIETFPNSYYAKSAAGIAAQIEWANILGVPNHTLNIFDYLGSPMAHIPKYGEALRSRKSEFDSFAEAFSKVESMTGIGVLHSPSAPASVHTEKGESHHELAPRGDGWANPLRAFGVPIVYGNDQRVTAVTGQTLYALGENELETVFSKGVLLDGSALETLVDMGGVDLAGAEIERICPPHSVSVGAEELLDPEFGGEKQAYLWTFGNWPKYVLRLAPETRMISRIVTIDGEFLFPGVSLFENALGGRIVVFPFDLGGSGLDPTINRESPSFYSEYRKRQIRAVVKWLGRGWIPLEVDADGWILPHRADATAGSVSLAAMNLNADPWERVTMRASMTGEVNEVTWSDVDGTWRVLAPERWNQKDDLVTIHLTAQVPHLRSVAVKATN